MFLLKIPGDELELEVEVEEQKYTEAEIESLFKSCLDKMDETVLGENKDFSCVSKPLNLISKIKGYPFVVDWMWYPYQVLNSKGEIQVSEISDDGTLVQLTGVIRYGESEIEYNKTINLLPPKLSDKTILEKHIIEEIERNNEDSITEEVLKLPTVVDSLKLTWLKKTSYRGIGILLMGVSSIILLLWRKKEAKRVLEENRKLQMETDYPEIVYQFALYIGAGLTVKNAWIRIVETYQDSQVQRYAYDEMYSAVIEMKNGVTEVESYERFGIKCGNRNYRRFSLLLIQNVRKGTKGVGAMLELEATEAFQVRKNHIKQLAEKAGTKLLLPMVLMLAVVLTIIVVPAFCSIQLS